MSLGFRIARRVAFAGMCGALIVLVQSCCGYQGDVYECNCTATCQGQPVSSFSTPCADGSGDARDQGVSACERELSECGSVSCSCSCSKTEDQCDYEQCGHVE